MKRILMVAVALLLATSVFAQQSEENTINVNGCAEREIVPDQIYLSIVLDEADTKGRIDVDEQRRDMVAALKSLGIDVEKSLTVADVSSSYFKRNTSFKVAKYQLELSSSEQVMKVYDALGALKISNVDIVRVSHSKIEQFKREIRREAMQNARQVAVELAEAVGQTIGACTYIYDSNRGVTPSVYNSGVVMMRSKAATELDTASSEVALEFKKIKLSYTVSARFELKK